MVNYLQLGQSLMKHFPQTEGCTSTIKIGKKGMEALGKRNPELSKLFSELTNGITEPTVEMAQKIKGNYGIAGFKIYSGDSVISKGAYSISQKADDVVEKVHIESDGIITKIAKENGKTKMDIVDSSILPKIVDDIAPEVHELTHKERVDSIFRRQFDVIKGLDSNNLWQRKDLMNTAPEDLKSLVNALDNAAKKGIKIPYSKDCEYIEMPLTMTDGRKHLVKMFPRFYDGKVCMRMYMDDNIPADVYKTYRNVSLEAGDKQHPGVAFKLELKDFSKQARDTLNKLLSSEDANTRLQSRIILANLIDENWTKSVAEDFVESYALETRSHLKHIGRLQSPLKPM